MTTTPKLGTKDLLKAQRWVVERESNLLPLLYKLNSLTPIPSLANQIVVGDSLRCETEGYLEKLNTM